jgi:hypothetical protein
MLIAHRSPREMVRSLVSYMRNPREIMSAVRQEFPDSTLSLRFIIDARESYLRDREFLSRGKKATGMHCGSREPGSKNIEAGTRALHKALWQHHPRIMRRLGAVQP